MAERRMFSKRITESARFLKMPTSTQALYFHLGLNADDDGVVEGYTIMRQIGATEDDLRILVGKNFINILNEDLVIYITDWLENNKIRSDRKVDSIYKPLLIQMLPDVNLQKTRLSKKNDNQVTTNGQPSDNQMSAQDRLGKDRLVEVRIEDTMSVSAKADPIPYQEIIDYLNQKTGKKFRVTTSANKSLIKARFKEGFTESDFKQVIDNKVSTWINDKKMTEYLRPQTLFGTKFESYLNDVHQSQVKQERFYE